LHWPVSASNATFTLNAAMLPMTLLFRDYNAMEKVCDLPGRLSTQGSPDGHDASSGDFTYYAMG
jgi:hypothetical protein